MVLGCREILANIVKIVIGNAFLLGHLVRDRLPSTFLKIPKKLIHNRGGRTAVVPPPMP